MINIMHGLTAPDFYNHAEICGLNEFPQHNELIFSGTLRFEFCLNGHAAEFFLQQMKLLAYLYSVIHGITSSVIPQPRGSA